MMRTPHAVVLVVVAVCGCAPSPVLAVLDAKLAQTNAIAFSDERGLVLRVDSAFPAGNDLVVGLSRRTGTSTSTGGEVPFPSNNPIDHSVIARVTRAGKLAWTDAAHASAQTPCFVNLEDASGALTGTVTCAGGDFAGAGDGFISFDEATGAVTSTATNDTSCLLSPAVDVGDGTVIALGGNGLERGVRDDAGCIAEPMWTASAQGVDAIDLDPATLHIAGDRVLADEILGDNAIFVSFNLDTGVEIESARGSSQAVFPAPDGWFTLDAPFNRSHPPKLEHLDVHGHVVASIAADGMRLLGVDAAFTSLFVARDGGGEAASIAELPRE